MELRKEQVILIGTAAVLIAIFVLRPADAPTPLTPGVKPAKAPVFAHHAAPDPALVLPDPTRVVKADARDIFSPPSDTHPLPPLELVPPPVAALQTLRPPPEPGPAPALFGKFLRGTVAPLDIPDLFTVSDEVETEAPSATPAGSAAGTQTPKVALSPDEQAARLVSYKKLYDWYRVGEYRFGQIRNDDRYNLAKRRKEDILFVDFNPDTGLPRFPGQAPVAIPRATVAEFDFAQSIPNEIEIRRAKLGNPLTALDYDDALQLAEWCIEQRLQTPRALKVAEEIFTRAASFLAEDPAPRLGLARVYEASFQFEKAFTLYRDLLAGSMQRNALVLVRLAQLEARFRMFDTAEERLVEAERFGRNSWQVQNALGRFLLERGRAVDAVPHLRLATDGEPTGAESKRTRAELRTDLGRGLLATGSLQEGADWFDKALQADPTEQRAQAGQICAALLAGKSGTSGSSGGSTGGANGGPSGAGGDSQGFELLFATGLDQALTRTPEAARKAKTTLIAAASADPLRAYMPWRSLSWLAETTGHPEEAQRYIDLAYENAPDDPWTLYQRGRILAARDDLDGAVEMFTAALDREIGFVDTLAQLGEIAHRRADFASAERFFERALTLDPTLAGVMALRGVNFLEMGSLRDAEACFRKVLALDADQPTARNGLAWCFYRKGDSTEAYTRFSELDDNRRALPEDDAHRVYAKAQIARIKDHEEKVVWSDGFERRELHNGWDRQENNGPTLSIHDGVLSLTGTFQNNGRARVWQKKNANDFVALEAKITIKSGTTSRVGLFVSRETQRSGESQTEAEVTCSRHNEAGKNTLQTRVMKRGQEDLEYTDVQGFEWKLDQPMTVRIERSGASSDTKVRILFDGIPVLDWKAMPTLGVTQNELFLGVFAEGQTGRIVQVDIDDVEIVYRQKK